MIFFTSDLHFNHANAITYCNRPFVDVREMNEAIIARWNALVQPGDNVYVLGDFAFWKADDDQGVPGLFARLNGHKHLVKGNHDERNPKTLQLPWASKSDLITVKQGNSRIICCHYPLETWKGAQNGYLHLHGHSHGNMKRVIPHRWDIGVDCHDFTPVSFDTVVAWGLAQTFEAQDHHGD